MKLERWMIEAIVLVGLAFAGYGLWVHHDETQQKIGAEKVIKADKDATDKQRAADEALIAAAEKQHVKELTDVALAYNAKPTAHVVCHAVPSSPVPASAGGTSASGPSTDGQNGDDVHPDITPALWVFALRMDEANADLRRLNSECSHAAP